MEDDTPMGLECQTCGMIKSCICPEPIYWTTKEGKKIPLHKIEDRHLKNIYNMLIRNNTETKEMLQIMFGIEDWEWEGVRTDTKAWLQIIKAELHRRKETT